MITGCVGCTRLKTENCVCVYPINLMSTVRDQCG